MTDLAEPTTTSLAAAMVAALAELVDLQRERTATVETRGGGSYSYAYSSLADVLGAVRPVLAAHGLAVTQPVAGHPGSVTVWTKLLHVSGDAFVSPALELKAGDSPQAIGSAITYARRYSLLATLGLATEDDDGAAAVRPTAAPSPRRVRATPRSGQPTDDQRRLSMALFRDLGVTDRDVRLARTSELIGRDVTSWNDLTPTEARLLIDRLTELVAEHHADTSPSPYATAAEVHDADDELDREWLRQAREDT